MRELLAWAFSLDETSTAVDLAAGTGKSTRLLTETGAAVIAVEPLAAMRAHLAESLVDVDLRDGTAEEMPVASESVDAVVAAQAFHWFAPEAALAEIVRVLRPGGGLALIWNVRGTWASWVRALDELVLATTGGKPYAEGVDWHETVAASGAFERVREHRFANPQAVDLARVIERLESTSFVSALPDAERDELLARARQLLAEDPDLDTDQPFIYPHHTVVYWTRRR